ncbi:MAG: RimK-like protein [Phycisphaerae bacterium]|nr:RimK-like protein [Phycisphaerae bacterium]
MILLVANSRDFATDYVVAELRRRGVTYHRLDLDLLADDTVALDPVQPALSIRSEGRDIAITHETLTAILYRAPTYLRESSVGRWKPEELLKRHQWAAFVRSLIVFDQARWINHPQAVYTAECKPYQLLCANRTGFTVPATLIGNTAPHAASPIWDSEQRAALKALDSFLVRMEDQDAFLYTQRVGIDDVHADSLSSMPAVLQQHLKGKLDIRVTVVGETCYAASVKCNGAGIEGDWRLAKEDATFAVHLLPNDIQMRCVELTRMLHLTYGAIDLALVGDVYYFLEINPTGEWAWLLEPTGMRIDRALADALCAGER